MNVAVIDIKGFFKYIIRIIIIISLIIILIRLFSKAKNSINVSNEALVGYLGKGTSLFSYKSEQLKFEEYDFKKILALELSMFGNIKVNEITEPKRD